MKVKYPILLGFGLVVLFLFYWPSEKDRLNAQMIEICKKDGGVKIYEMVKLPEEWFDDSGLLRSQLIKESNAYVRLLGRDYKLVSKSKAIKKGEPSKDGLIMRSHIYIQRLSDGRIMAEAVQYFRGGGDRWFAGMPSSESCPDMPINLVELAITKE